MEMLLVSSSDPMQLRRFLFVILVAAALSCQGEQKPAAATPATEAEAKKFFDDYYDALVTPNVERAAQLIDSPALMARATERDHFDWRWRKAFQAKSSRAGHRFVTGLSGTLERGGELTLVRVRKVAGETRVVLRLVHADGTLNYHEMPLFRDASGFVRAPDIYDYASGEYLSDTLRRLFLTGVATDPNLVQTLAGKENPVIAAAAHYKVLVEKIHAGDGKGAVEAYNRIPAELRRDKAVMLSYVMAASKISDAAYVRAIEEFRAAFPNEKRLDLIFMDGHLLARRYDEALRCIDRVDEALGGDPYLDVVRSRVYLDRGDLDKAQELAVRVSTREPELEDGWWAQVDVSLVRKDFARTAKLLAHLRDRLEVELDDLTKHPAYADFVKSPHARPFLP